MDIWYEIQRSRDGSLFWDAVDEFETQEATQEWIERRSDTIRSNAAFRIIKYTREVVKFYAKRDEPRDTL
jgi:hypothetical protein